MVDPLKRIMILLVICVFLIFLMVPPALAKSDRTDLKSTTSASSNSGKGMNRQGGPSTHPGKGWKDPGSWQGSPKNTSDPDCTGNRTSNPQSTNIGACDDSAGAADKPEGKGGFDSDKDWNNGCGNDTDFEDDNNGRCGRRSGKVSGSSSTTDPPPEEEKKIVTRVLSSVTARPAVVLSERVAAQRTSLPATGIDANQLAFAGISLMAIGKSMVRRARGNRH